jgi:hypothetical protein
VTLADHKRMKVGGQWANFFDIIHGIEKDKI